MPLDARNTSTARSCEGKTSRTSYVHPRSTSTARQFGLDLHVAGFAQRDSEIQAREFAVGAEPVAPARWVDRCVDFEALRPTAF